MIFLVVDNNENDLDLLTQTIAVAMLSDSELNRVDAIHEGANDYLLKPVSAGRLGGVIKQLAL